jgi:hypothetical protein
MLNFVLWVMLIIYVHLKGRNPEKTMTPLCATTDGVRKQETYIEEITTARYWTEERKTYQQPCTSVTCSVNPYLQDYPQMTHPWLRFGLVDESMQGISQ